MAIKQWLYHTFWNRTWKKFGLGILTIFIVIVVIVVVWANQHPLTNYIQAEQATLDRIEGHFWIDQPVRSSINNQLASDASITDYEIGFVGSSNSSDYHTITSLLMSTGLSLERKMNPNAPQVHYDMQASTLGLNWLEGSLYQDEQLTALSLPDWLDYSVGFNQSNTSYIPSLYKQQSSSDKTNRSGVSSIQMFMDFLQELEVEDTALNHQEDQIDLTISESQANDLWQQAFVNQDAIQQEQLQSFQVDGEMVYSATYEDDFVSSRTWEVTVVNDDQEYDVQLSMQSSTSNGEMIVDGQALVTNQADETVLDIRLDASSDERLDDQVQSEQTLIIDYPISDFAEGIRLDWQTQATAEQSEITFEVAVAKNGVKRLASGQLNNQYSNGEEGSTHNTELSVSIDNPDLLGQPLPFEEWELSVDREHQFPEEVQVQSVDRNEVEMFEPAMLDEWKQTLENLVENPQQILEDQLDLPF